MQQDLDHRVPILLSLELQLLAVVLVPMEELPVFHHLSGALAALVEGVAILFP
jgi:hypothetical protein